LFGFNAATAIITAAHAIVKAAIPITAILPANDCKKLVLAATGGSVAS
jgi:hypothetical protein